MFDIVMQRNDSEKNRVDKTLTTIATLSGTLKQETSIINPVFTISADLADYVQCNYVTVPTFGRSYFVTDITSVRSDLVEITCHVDVLSSFKTEIRANSAIVHRQEKLWNLYLNDGSFRVYQNPMVLTKAFPSGFTAQEIVIAIAGS